MATRHVYGAIDPNGGVPSGQSFQCRNMGQGTYHVEFERPFAQPPSPVCTVFGPPWQTFNLSAAIVNANPGSRVYSTSSPNMPQDCGVSIIIVDDD